MTDVGPIGRLGRFMAQHFALVATAWVVVAVGLGVLAPKVEHALSGAGWEATGSESVKARELIDRNFDGLGSYGLMVVVHSPDATVGDPPVRVVAAQGRGDPALQRCRDHGRRPAAGHDDLQGRPHRGRAGRRREERQRHGARGGRPQGRAGRHQRPGRRGQPHRRPRHVVGLQRGQQDAR